MVNLCAATSTKIHSNDFGGRGQWKSRLKCRPFSLTLRQPLGFLDASIAALPLHKITFICHYFYWRRPQNGQTTAIFFFLPFFFSTTGSPVALLMTEITKPMSQASQASEINDEFLQLPEVREHLERIDAEAEALAGANSTTNVHSNTTSTPDLSPSKRRRITATPKAQDFTFLKNVAARRDAENSVFDASTSSDVVTFNPSTSSYAVPPDPFQLPAHLQPSQTAATAQYLLQRLSASPHPQHPPLLDALEHSQFALTPTFFGHQNLGASVANAGPSLAGISAAGAEPPPPPSSQICPEPLMSFTEPPPPSPGPPSPPPLQIYPGPPPQLASEPLRPGMRPSTSSENTQGMASSPHAPEIDSLFETTFPSSGGNGDSDTFADRRGGRPTKEQIRAIEQGFSKVDQAFRDLAVITKLEVPVLLARYYALVNDVKSAKFHNWNAYQSYAVDTENKAIELARINATNVDWEPGQLQIAYLAFMKAHGDEKGQEILKLWLSTKPLSETQQKAQRRRVFENAIRQLESLGDRLRNLYQIHLFALMVGGQVQNDQSLQHVYEKFKSAGFSQKGYVMDAEALIAAFKTHVYEGTLKEFTDQQLIMMCELRGLTVTGPGVNVAATATSATATSSTSQKKSSAKPDNGIQKVVLAIAEEEGITFPGNGLPWDKLGNKCLEMGLQMYNYPVGVLEPWNTSKIRRQGIKNLPEEQQQALIDQCAADEEHRFSFRRVDFQDLNDGKIAILVFAPDEEGERKSTFADKVDSLKTKVKSSSSRHKARSVKAEDDDVSIPPPQQPVTPSRRVTRATRKRAGAGTIDNNATDNDSEVDDSWYINDPQTTPKPVEKGKSALKDASKSHLKDVSNAKQSKPVVPGEQAQASRSISITTDSVKRKQCDEAPTAAKRPKVGASAGVNNTSDAGSSTLKGFTNFEPIRKAQSVAPGISSVEFGVTNTTASSSKGPSSATASVPKPHPTPVPVGSVSSRPPVPSRPVPIQGPAPTRNSAPAPPPTSTPAPVISRTDFAQGDFQSLPLPAASPSSVAAFSEGQSIATAAPTVGQPQTLISSSLPSHSRRLPTPQPPAPPFQQTALLSANQQQPVMATQSLSAQTTQSAAPPGPLIPHNPDLNIVLQLLAHHPNPTLAQLLRANLLNGTLSMTQILQLLASSG
ncbi:hypothetical protein PM082_014815 [Marasmius tenuissimus]|nr:hypothetical protein PM082_014815 [Marasmius tenuissimus]